MMPTGASAAKGCLARHLELATLRWKRRRYARKAYMCSYVRVEPYRHKPGKG
jgi:hypothetical protein